MDMIKISRVNFYMCFWLISREMKESLESLDLLDHLVKRDQQVLQE